MAVTRVLLLVVELVAREVSRNPDVLLAAQPTRGLDVGAIEFVHRRLVEERDDGSTAKTTYDPVGNPVDRMYQRVKSQRVPERMEYFYPHYKIWMEISASPLIIILAFAIILMSVVVIGVIYGLAWVLRQIF